jgi:hypothetical protein
MIIFFVPRVIGFLVVINKSNSNFGQCAK